MPIIKTETDYWGNIVHKEEITLLDLFKFEDFDGPTGKLEQMQNKLNNLCDIVCEFIESVPEGKDIIKKYIRYSCFNGITYEEPIDDPR